ncbi:hypothetical protein BT96DRAFT_949227 [Gymnopus androsaceus JB14]|uniref:Uncharacterized protein n=1 Tax=Gymnopus androsaceus JB14 TaxID=1447944 RepID=A0A6A4GLR1_9AGAR|nr:hypothetical protein BT96DRAFT_949227 [Gymnopus androsaceus JB14]
MDVDETSSGPGTPTPSITALPPPDLPSQQPAPIQTQTVDNGVWEIPPQCLSLAPDPDSPTLDVSSASSPIMLAGLLAAIKDTPILKDDKTFPQWEHTIQGVLIGAKLINHIIVSTPPEAIRKTVWNTPSYHPEVGEDALPQEIRAQEIWDSRDAVVVQVITNRLSKEAQGILPPALDYVTGMPSLWAQFCSHRQSMGLAILESKLRTTHIEGDKIPEWIVKWKSMVGCLQSAGYPIVWPTLLSTFAQLLPSSRPCSHIAHEIQKHIDHPELFPNKPLNYNAFHAYTSEVHAAYENDKHSKEL